MTRRLVWLLLGLGLGYWLLRRLGLVSASPSAIAGRAAGRAASLAGSGAERSARSAVDAVRGFAGEVRSHAAEREAELRAALAADVTDPESAARAEAARHLLEHPNSPADQAR
ncbi:MAG: hypothetical protein ACFCVG_19105 [Kineosporiaceae bacterium]